MYRTTAKMAERKAARRSNLLRSAMRIFGRKGYHATTVPMIVRSANSSVGSFYFCFRNKEDIFAAVLEAIGERISSALNQAIHGAGPDVLTQMTAAVEALVSFLVGNPEKARILIVESSGLGKRLEAVRRQLIVRHTRGVEEALRALSGSLPPLDPAIVASCWVGAALEAVLHWLEQPPDQHLPAEHFATSVARFNLRGIGARVEVIEEQNHDKQTERPQQHPSGIDT